MIHIEHILRGMQAHFDEMRRQTNVRERAYLRSLDWTDEQLTAFDSRVAGIHARADRVLRLDLSEDEQ